MVSTERIKQLRELTGARMMDCKEALLSVDGDIEKAKDWLRKKGIASAVKKSSREALEGVIGVITKGSFGAVLEVNSETDFVARNADFQQLVHQILHVILEKRPDTVEALKQLPLEAGTVEEHVLATAGTLGENLILRRLSIVSVPAGHVIGYVHAPLGPDVGKIGVLVGFHTDAPDVQEWGKKIAMHVAASSPDYVRIEDIPKEVLDREREILLEQVRKENRPEEVMQKMIDGRLRKFCEEQVLEEQFFIFESDKKVKVVLDTLSKTLPSPLRVTSMVRLALGEAMT